MNSFTYHQDSSHIPLGERRRKTADLARFSLDLSWARGVSEAARGRAYPSPPMSGSPPIPPRRNPEFDERGQGSFVLPGQDPRGPQTPQTEPRDIVGLSHLGQYQQDPRLQPSFAQYPRPGDGAPIQYQYQPQHPAQVPPQQYERPPPQPIAPMSMYPSRLPQVPGSFVGSESMSLAAPPEFVSPKSQRKTKGHVASACVPCKRAHLRCDAQRPCSRCVSNGKDDACVDVQHKKRGRPRLRDDREPRFEGLGSNFNPQTEQMMRRPMPMFHPNEIPSALSDPLGRPSSYRVLKSQAAPPPPPSRFLEHASTADTNVYGGTLPPTSRTAGLQDVPCAYLNMDWQIAVASRSFCEGTGNPSVVARKLLDLVTANDRDKVYRLQRLLEEERQEREPNYLPPIYGNAEGDRVIQSIGLNTEDIAQFRPERPEILAFQGPDGQQRVFQVRIGLYKKESTYFVVMILIIPAAAAPQPLPSTPYTREQQYGFQTSQQLYASQHQAMSPYNPYPPQYSDPRGREQPITYHQPPPIGSNFASNPNPTPIAPSFPQMYARPEYGQPAHGRQVPRSEVLQGQPSLSNALLLPPIRRQSGPSSATGRIDDRSGRVDIGGLLENPESSQSRS